MLLLGDYIGSHKSLLRDAIVTAWLLATTLSVERGHT